MAGLRGWGVLGRAAAVIAGAAAVVAAQGPAQATPSAFDSSADLVSSASLPASTQQFNNVAKNVKRSRLVQLQAGVLPAQATGQRVRFELFPGAVFSGKFTGTNKVMDMDAWSGTLDGGGYFLGVRSQDAVIVHVASKRGVFEVSKAGPAAYRVVELDQTKNTEDAPRTLPVGRISSADASAASGAQADSAGQIDVMMATSRQALIGEGTLAALKARIGLGIQETNQGYAQSGVMTRLRLVHIESTSYNESGSFDTDLSRLATSGDGFLDIIQSARNYYAADMVGMVIENTSYCGLANAILANANNAYMTVSRSCTTGYYSLAHEFGHLQGARHDTYVDSSTTPYAYGHGYTYPSAGWRTIMAYNNACSAAGTNCTRLNYWSNPNNSYGGVAMGTVAVNHNASVLNETAGYVANFKTARIAPDFISSFNGFSSGWSPVTGYWTQNPTNISSEGLAATGVSLKRNGTYGDLTMKATIRRAGEAGSANRIFVRGNPNSLSGTNWWNSSYVFQWTNSGQFSIWYVNAAGAATALKDWTTTTAVKSGLYNQIEVQAVGTILRFKINGTLVATVVNNSLRTGQVGIGMWTAAPGGGNLLQVDNVQVQTTPTADVRADEPIASGVTLRGGTFDRAPKR
jgi:hypothetical protein